MQKLSTQYGKDQRKLCSISQELWTVVIGVFGYDNSILETWPHPEFLSAGSVRKPFAVSLSTVLILLTAQYGFVASRFLQTPWQRSTAGSDFSSN